MPYGMGSEIGWKEVEPMSKGAALAHLALMADEAERVIREKPVGRWNGFSNETGFNGFNSGEPYIAGGLRGDTQNTNVEASRTYWSLNAAQAAEATADSVWPQFYVKYAMERELNNVPLRESPNELRKMLARQALAHLERLNAEVDMQLGEDYRPDLLDYKLKRQGLAHQGSTAFLQNSRDLYPVPFWDQRGKLMDTAIYNPEAIINGIPKYVNENPDLYREYTSPEAIARRTTLAHTIRSYHELLPVSDALGLAIRDRVLVKNEYPSIMTDDRRISGPSAELFRALRDMAETGQYKDYSLFRRSL
jgi:hypothetical protein